MRRRLRGDVPVEELGRVRVDRFDVGGGLVVVVVGARLRRCGAVPCPSSSSSREVADAALELFVQVF